MKKTWRPANWPESKCDKCTTKQVDDYGFLCDLSCGEHAAYLNFEAGADAMLKSIIKWNKETCIGLDLEPLPRGQCSHCWEELEKGNKCI